MVLQAVPFLEALTPRGCSSRPRHGVPIALGPALGRATDSATMIKMAMWPNIHADRLMRELKRIELQLARSSIEREQLIEATCQLGASATGRVRSFPQNTERMAGIPVSRSEADGLISATLSQKILSWQGRQLRDSRSRLPDRYLWFVTEFIDDGALDGLRHRTMARSERINKKWASLELAQLSHG